MSAASGELGADAERVAGVLRPGATVIVWGGEADHSLVDLAGKLDAKLLEVPAERQFARPARGGLPAGRGPGSLGRGPGGTPPRSATRLADGDLDAALLLNADPVRDFPGGPEWSEALGKAEFVLAVSMFENASTRHADVVFPAEFYAEKEGTVTHPDGRLQRLRPGVPHPGRVRPIWQVLVELSALLGEETGIDSAPEALEAIASEVPFYAGISTEEIGGRGVRWQERGLAASAFPRRGSGALAWRRLPVRPQVTAGCASGTYRDLWAAEVTDRSPALRFLAPEQALEISPADADRLGLGGGDEVDVRSNGTSLRARVAIRERVRPGSGFLIDGTWRRRRRTLRGELGRDLQAGGVGVTLRWPRWASPRRPGSWS